MKYKNHKTDSFNKRQQFNKTNLNKKKVQIKHHNFIIMLQVNKGNSK